MTNRNDTHAISDTSIEEWRPVASHPGWTASDHGRVQVYGEILCPRLEAEMVCEAFHGPRPTPDHRVMYIDGDQTDTSPVNVRWVTLTEYEEHEKWVAKAIIKALYGRE
jgi:hypothetical protein